MSHHLPKRLRLNCAKRRQQRLKLARQIARDLYFPGLHGLTSTADIEVRVKRRRRWTKEHDRRYVKRYPSVTGTIGGRSRAKVWGWDPAKARSDMTVAIGMMLDAMHSPRHWREPIIFMSSRDFDLAVAGKHPLFPPPENRVRSEIYGLSCTQIIADDILPPGRPIILNPGELKIPDPVWNPLDELEEKGVRRNHGWQPPGGYPKGGRGR